MGVFDDIKDSFSESESSDDLGSNVEGSSDLGSADGLDDSRFNDSFSNDQPSGSQQGQTPQENQSLNQNSQRGNTNQSQSSRQPSGQTQNSARENGRNMRQNNRQNNQPESSPNAQAGRPQSGSSEPQLSSQTRKKLDNAGLSDSSPPQNQRSQNRNGQRAQQGNSTQSVAEGQDDLEQIKSQNRQIIELLKRINQSLNGSQGNL